MINAKKIYNSLLNNEKITNLIPGDNILNAYPDDLEIYPCIIFLDDNQNDDEYNDNKPAASYCSVQIHIFSKKLTNYVSTAEVAVTISEVFNDDLWNCIQNGEVSDPSPNVEHRVMRFNKSIFN